MIEHDEFSWIDVKAETVPFPYDQTGFSELLQSCGKDDSRAPELAESFAGLFGVSYTFTYKGEAQDGGEWTVSLFENVRGYVSLADLQKDFEACYAGGDYYPFAVTERFTAFASACGSGFDDGSGRSHGCDEVRTAVEPTITVF